MDLHTGMWYILHTFTLLGLKELKCRPDYINPTTTPVLTSELEFINCVCLKGYSCSLKWNNQKVLCLFDQGPWVSARSSAKNNDRGFGCSVWLHRSKDVGSASFKQVRLTIHYIEWHVAVTVFDDGDAAAAEDHLLSCFACGLKDWRVFV